MDEFMCILYSLSQAQTLDATVHTNNTVLYRLEVVRQFLVMWFPYVNGVYLSNWSQHR